MNRTWETIGNLFGSVGVAALAAALLMVPNADLNAAVSSTPTCEGDKCELIACTNYWTLHGECPDECSNVKGTYCKCSSDPVNCWDCICTKNPVQNACSCRLKQ